jgi:hypothetical protein
VWSIAQPVRLVHDLLMYLFLAFVVHHVYSALLIDIEVRSGLVSSIITGYKALTSRHIADAADQVPTRRRGRRDRHVDEKAQVRDG